jgi:hypothetical protein
MLRARARTSDAAEEMERADGDDSVRRAAARGADDAAEGDEVVG